MKENKYPPRWDADRVRKVLKHYEHQTAEEAVAEDEAALDEKNETVMNVPHELVSTVRQLIAKHHG